MGTLMSVLLVEDEVALGQIIKDSLQSRGFVVSHVIDGGSAYDAYVSYRPSIIILDVMLPTESGLNIAKKIRLEDKHTPILFLTARAMPGDLLNGYEAGGNDYLKKPFDMEELIVRVKVLLNQNRLLEDTQAGLSKSTVNIGTYIYDMVHCTLSNHGITKKLTAREAEVLKVLYQNRNRLLDRKAFLLQIWGDDDFFSSRSLDVFITKLRKNFVDDPMVQIINHRGFGYKLVF
jgi:two-component system response regulator VicR